MAERYTPSRALLRGRYDADGRLVPNAPEEATLQALLHQAWDEMEKQRQIDARIEELMDDKHDLALPDIGIESEEFRGGWASELVYRIRQWWPTSPSIRIPTPGVGDDPEHFANDLEEALNALIDVQAKQRRGPGGPFFDSLKTDVITFGRGFAALLPDPRAYKGYPIAPSDDSLRDAKMAKAYLEQVESFGKMRLPPLKLRHMPSRRVMPMFDDDGLAEVFWVTTERAATVMERAEAQGTMPNKALRWVEEDYENRAHLQVPVIHYANRCYYACMVGTPSSFPPTLQNANYIEGAELIIRPAKHWLEDRVPVAYFPGMSTPLSEYHKTTVSAVYQLRHIITMLDRVASMKATAVRTWAWPTPVLKTSLVNAGLIEADHDGRPRVVEISPGMMVTLWPDEDISFLTYQGNGPDQDEVLSLLQRQFDRLGLPSVESGSAADSGYLFAQMRQAAKGKWSAIESGLKQGWEDLAWIELGYLQKLPHDVYVPTVEQSAWAGMGTYRDRRTESKSSYLKISPKKLRDRTFLLDVRLEPDKSLDLVANAQAALAMKQLGLPDQLIWENVLGLENTDRIRLMKMMEDLRMTDQYRQVVFQRALEQGQLLLEEDTSMDPNAQGIPTILGELMNYAPAQIMAMAQAGLIDPALAEQAIAVQSQNVMAGQVGGAMAGGNAPGSPMMAALPAPGGSMNATAITGAAGPAMPQAGTTAMGAMGGGSSPLTMTPTAPRPRNNLSTGRAAGQSRKPPRPRKLY